jgi:formate dehydrogenase maturation protein FdhE
VDLSEYGLAVPVVDELAALPLDVWAMEQGYRKVEPNLAGI